jgi:hypothetical protein
LFTRPGNVIAWTAACEISEAGLMVARVGNDPSEPGMSGLARYDLSAA